MIKKIQVGLFCFFYFGATVQAQVKNSKPNILIILTDDQGYHDVSYYGTKDIHTPHIDALCKAGMRFDYFYTNAPVCAPTRASLLSGRYPDLVGVPGLIRSTPDNNWGYLQPGTKLLPQQLKQVGYHTAHIGKWNLGLETPNLPNEKGFDLFHGWLEDMMDDYWTHLRHGKNFMRLNYQPIEPVGHATELFTQWSVDYLKEQANAKNPFFLYLAYNAPHFPVSPPAEWLAKIKKREPQLSDTRAKLVAFIEHMDDNIGKVIATLKANGQYENTIILFLSDNGGHLPSESNNGDLRDGKQSMYEGGLRVPAVISWPKMIKAGSISSQVNLTMDIYPTLLEIAGVTIKHKIEGRSFLNTLIGEKNIIARGDVNINSLNADTNRVLYFTRREGGMEYGGKAYHAIRQGDWKMLQNNPYQPLELYNLRLDPQEKNNLIKQEPKIAEKLNALLLKQIQESGKVPWQKANN